MNDYLKQLNPSQQEAVKAIEGPVMIIAGADQYEFSFPKFVNPTGQTIFGREKRIL